MDYSKVIEAMKELPASRFFALWLWLLLFPLSPLVYAVAKLVEALK